MPEILEAEIYRQASVALVGRTIAEVECRDPEWIEPAGTDAFADALIGHGVLAARRHGKLVLLDTEGPCLGLHFGMSGRLRIDGATPLPVLEYTSAVMNPDWDRFVLGFDDGGVLAVNDPRRLGKARLDPILPAGVDAWSATADDLANIFDSRRAVKAVLLDQKKIAGLGNLLSDELLWRCSIAPNRVAREIEADEIRHLASDIAPMLDELLARGGSTSGDFFSARVPGSRCPRDGAMLATATIGGRTTRWCPKHQR